ncbi:ATP-binding cassette domain-containing protein [Nonomuraea sp. NPDC050556]|uniref:ATP-binding cassette domain-containing protein n=1 Tax=Nonomuraea sp. NPDC050556 TaxID=3364369 RepID=UPI00379C63B2
MAIDGLSYALRAEGVRKSFGTTEAVRHVDLAVPAGTVLGLLGPNGAGKTTVVRMFATLVRPDAGRIEVHGYDVVRQPQQVRTMIGLTGQYATVDGSISGRENLYLVGRLLNLSPSAARRRADELLERFDLVAAGRRPVRTYSGGMRRRVDLAVSMIGNPRVLFLDEPTTGLDPRSRNSLWDEIRLLVAAGTTVLLTTQYMEEAEALADAIVVIDSGQIVATGTPTELRAAVGGQVLQVRPADPADLAAVATVLASIGSGTPMTLVDDGLVALPIGGDAELTEAIHALAAAGLRLAGIDTHLPSLDEVFLSLTSDVPGRTTV